MKIYMIRHGETDWNKKRKLQGQVDIPLNEFGKLLAKETAPALADVPFGFDPNITIVLFVGLPIVPST